MKVAIMQPYFLPYIGYFQLINAVDVFVIYDNIKYTKKGWINRNRFLRNGEAVGFSLPLKKDSDFLEICDRQLATEFEPKKLAGQLKEAYRKAPFFTEVCPLVERLITFPEKNLFAYIRNSLDELCTYLGIHTRILTSSHLPLNHSLAGVDRVVSICKHLAADTYINPIGGTELYENDTFATQGIKLFFLQSEEKRYPQFGGNFVPWLSIIDVLMFNGRERSLEMIQTQWRPISLEFVKKYDQQP